MNSAVGKLKNVLYVSWDGPQVSYLEGLFLPIFLGLRERGYAFHVLQFTWDEPRDLQKEDKVDTSATEVACGKAGIPYERITICRRLGGIGPYLSARSGSAKVDSLVAKWSIDVIMPRSIMGAIAVAHSDSVMRLPVVFDADGLAADERADFNGLSRSSFTYLMLKFYERHMISRAQAVIGRTQAACRIYEDYDKKPSAHKYFVSVNGRDPRQFYPTSEKERLAARGGLGLPHKAPIILHSGSFGEKYCPNDEIDFVQKVRERQPDTHFLILTGETLAATRFVERELGEIPNWIVIRYVPFREMAPIISSCDFGLCFVSPAVSTQAVQATKLGEFLLSGLSVVATPNMLTKELLGMPFAFSWQPYPGINEAAARWFNNCLSNRESLRAHARAFALKYLTVDESVCAYDNALRRAICG